MGTMLNLLHTTTKYLGRLLDQYRYTTPMVSRLAEDADYRRMGHDIDAIRTRFEQQPTWPTSGVRADSR